MNDLLDQNIPGYKELVAAGITKYSELPESNKLTDIAGIGKKTAVKIAEYLGDKTAPSANGKRSIDRKRLARSLMARR